MREIAEESGVKVPFLEPLFEFYHAPIRVWGKAFRGYFDGEVEDLKPQIEEVDKVVALSLAEIEAMIVGGEMFTPDGL